MSHSAYVELLAVEITIQLSSKLQTFPIGKDTAQPMDSTTEYIIKFEFLAHLPSKRNDAGINFFFGSCSETSVARTPAPCEHLASLTIRRSASCCGEFISMLQFCAVR